MSRGLIEQNDTNKAKLNNWRLMNIGRRINDESIVVAPGEPVLAVLSFTFF